jgi:hypothetical protein
MIPGFPLDGGRLLRALLWKLMNHYGRATQWAAIIGLIFAITLILAGSLAFFASQFFIGFWLMVIGLYLSYLSKDGIQKKGNYKEQQIHTPKVKSFSGFSKQPVAVIEEQQK